MARERERWRVCQRYMDGERFIFLDETGASTNMTRLYGWGERGERLIDHAPHGHWKTTTFVAGLTANGIIAPFVVDGPMNGEMFRAYVEQMLLRPSGQATSWCLTTSRPTRWRASRRPSERPAPASCRFHPTPPISTQSSSSSPS